MKKLIFIMVSAIILLNSCAKPTYHIPNVTEEVAAPGALEGTKWKMTSLIAGQEIAGQKTEVDFFALADDCSKDDVMMFNAGSNFTYDEGPTKCSPSDPQQESGKWTLSADKKKLTLTSQAINNTPEPVVYDVVITSTKLTLTHNESMSITVEGKEVKTNIYTIITFNAIQ